MKENNSLHILFVSAWFPNRLTPYNGDFVQRHAKSVSKSNSVTAIFTIGDSSITQSEVTTVHQENYTEKIYYFPKSSFPIINFIRRWKSLQRAYREATPVDIIHANVIDKYVLWVVYQCIFHKKKFVLSEHWTGYYRELPSWRRLLSSIVSKYSSAIFPVSNNLKKAMQSSGMQANYEVIPNVISTDLFFPKQTTKRPKTKFIHVSMLNDAHKNITGQLNVILALHQKGYSFEYHIGGNGDLSSIKKFIKEHGLEEVIMPFGSLTHAEVAEKIQDSDCFVIFSNYETQSIVCLESFACGVPVIATKVGGLPENFQGNFGILIEKGNEKELEEAMIRVIDGESFDSKEEMFDFVNSNYSQEVISEKFNEQYRTILSNS